MMKKAGEIIKVIQELNLNAEEMEHWDGEPDMYTNQGWIEALRWVLGIGVKRNKNGDHYE